MYLCTNLLIVLYFYSLFFLYLSALNKFLLLVLLLNASIYVYVYYLILSSLTNFKDYSLVIDQFSVSLPNKRFIHLLKSHVNMLTKRT